MGQQIKGQTRPLEVVVTHNSHHSELSLPICIIGVAILPLEAGEAAEMYNMGTTVLVEWQGLSAVTCTSGPGGRGGGMVRKCISVPGHAQHKPHSTESRSDLSAVCSHMITHDLREETKE